MLWHEFSKLVVCTQATIVGFLELTDLGEPEIH